MCRLAAVEVAVDAHFGVAAHAAFKLRVIAAAVVGIQRGFPAGAVLFVWGGGYFCTGMTGGKKRRKTLSGADLSEAGARKNLHQLLL